MNTVRGAWSPLESRLYSSKGKACLGSTSKLPDGFKADGGYYPEISISRCKGEIEVFSNYFSICSQNTMMVLAEKGLYPNKVKCHEMLLIEMGDYDMLQKWYLEEINPRAVVPVLVHNGHPIYESAYQMQYIAETWADAGDPLIPEDPQLKQTMYEWMGAGAMGPNPGGTGAAKDFDIAAPPNAGTAIPGLTMPVFATLIKNIPTTRILKYLWRHPDPFRVVFFSMMNIGVRVFGYRCLNYGPLAKILTAARIAMAAELEKLDTHLKSMPGHYICGEQYTLADQRWLMIGKRLYDAQWEHLIDPYPELHAYFKRMMARPAFLAAVQGREEKMLVDAWAETKAMKAAHPEIFGLQR